MIKKLKYLLIAFPIILSVILIVNIIIYTNFKKNNLNIVKNSNNYQDKINQNNLKKEQLTTKINSLKEENKDKLWEYDRWIKWNQEIKAKIN